MSKWKAFHSLHSPLPLAKKDSSAEKDLSNENDLSNEKIFDIGLIFKDNAEKDWERQKGLNSVYINGKSLDDYLEKDPSINLSDSDSLRSFFIRVILKDAELSESDKLAAANYLLKVFHQGGLLRPVSGAMVAEMVQNQYLVRNRNYTSCANIITTKKGFLIQEDYTLHKLTPLDANDPENESVKPDLFYNYIIKAQATLNVDFSKNATNPDITIKNNSISYGSSAVQKVMDNRKRSFAEIILDFLKILVNYYKVDDLAKLSSEEEITPEERISPSM